MNLPTYGFGAEQGLLAIYIEHPPALSEFQKLNKVIALQEGEVDYINQQCGNGWRKVFNVYAKFIAELSHPDHDFTNQSKHYPSWQKYRDKRLLQQGCQEALLFSVPDLAANRYDWHIIAGRTYAKALLRDHIFTNSLHWIDEEFAIDPVNKLLICPYLDYRQLSNIKISKLAELILTEHAKVIV
ncbi:DUF6942 family protein [Pseudoalteromonas rubra]|uniref:Uncharacterized protein n=1 Tax=Pseudoalteromonas rubra TaxID=43658 RepID=A0A5S3X4I7_9GAMM|nr:hypothetical protein [Pseudoalteromonas rubra]TMP39310.1 hypothetical protein CWB98_01605 [Pseudoalteromonas rubra]